jgi:hypothetical protein
MKPRAIAIAGSIAALSLAASPIAVAASTPHASTTTHRVERETRIDRSHDTTARHVEKTNDTRSADLRPDLRDR